MEAFYWDLEWLGFSVLECYLKSETFNIRTTFDQARLCMSIGARKRAAHIGAHRSVGGAWLARWLGGGDRELFG